MINPQRVQQPVSAGATPLGLLCSWLSANLCLARMLQPVKPYIQTTLGTVHTINIPIECTRRRTHTYTHSTQVLLLHKTAWAARLQPELLHYLAAARPCRQLAQTDGHANNRHDHTASHRTHHIHKHTHHNVGVL